MSPSPMVKFVAFVKLSMEKFAISNWSKLKYVSEQPFLQDVYHYIIRRKSGFIFHLLGMTIESTYA